MTERYKSLRYASSSTASTKQEVKEVQEHLKRRKAKTMKNNTALMNAHEDVKNFNDDWGTCGSSECYWGLFLTHQNLIERAMSAYKQNAELVNAMGKYLPPNGTPKDEFLTEVIGILDKPLEGQDNE